MNLSVLIKKFDWILLTLVLAILAGAIFTFYGVNQRAGEIITREVALIAVGLIIVFSVSALDYRIFKNYSASSILIYTFAILLLLLALSSQKVRGVSSWIVIENLQFQPSEFAKLAVLILLAKYFSQKHAQIYSTRHILASGVYVGIPAFLTLIQPDFGSAAVFLGLWLAMLLFSGIKRKHLTVIIMLGLVLSSLAWFLFFQTYQKNRILSFLNPYLDPRGIGYSTIQAQTALGSGGLWGSFFKPGPQALVAVPEPYTDFTFAVLGNKLGLVGIFGLLFLVAALIFRLGLIVSRSSSNFPKLFILGFATILFIHATINAGMNLGVLPITGIPFPFLSYGGSYLITLMIGLGLVESIKIHG